MIAALGGVRNLRSRSRSPTRARSEYDVRAGRAARAAARTSSARRSRLGRRTAKRLRRSARPRGDVVALDGEVSNSTYAEISARRIPDRYFEMYIAEQQLVATAVGMQALGWRPFASTFAAFLSRAYDFIRMSAISRANYCLVGSHCRRLDRRGRAVADGARGHRLDPGAYTDRPFFTPATRTRPRNSSRRWPTPTASSTCERCARRHSVIYEPAEEFEIGGSRTLRSGQDVAIIGCGDHRARSPSGS